MSSPLIIRRNFSCIHIVVIGSQTKKCLIFLFVVTVNHAEINIFVFFFVEKNNKNAGIINLFVAVTKSMESFTRGFKTNIKNRSVGGIHKVTIDLFSNNLIDALIT